MVVILFYDTTRLANLLCKDKVFAGVVYADSLTIF
jgi:hypothetical protein